MLGAGVWVTVTTVGCVCLLHVPLVSVTVTLLIPLPVHCTCILLLVAPLRMVPPVTFQLYVLPVTNGVLYVDDVPVQPVVLPVITGVGVWVIAITYGAVCVVHAGTPPLISRTLNVHDGVAVNCSCTVGVVDDPTMLAPPVAVHR